MIVDSEELPVGHVVRASVAIIGAGPAGLATALELANDGVEVVVLESGRESFDPATQSLNQAESRSVPQLEPGTSRIRQLGGSTTIWSGRCLAFDPLDFERREWIPHSGWPFGFEELASAYERARQISCLALTDDELVAREEGFRLEGRSWLGEGMDVRFFDRQWGGYAALNRAELVENRRITVLLDATATALEVDDSGRSVAAVSCRTSTGRRFEVKASHFVLAGGGIENPRLLLLSDSVHTSGLGNEHGLVGRFFMDHPYVDGGVVQAGQLPSSLLGGETPDASNQQHPLLVASRSFQESNGAGGAAVYLVERPAYMASTHHHSAALRSVRAIRAARRLGQPLRLGARLRQVAPGVGHVIAHTARRGLHAVRPDSRTVARMVIEPMPNPASRITLSSNRDAHGLRQAVVQWRLSEADRNTYERFSAAFGEALIAAGGTYQPMDSVLRDWPHALNEGKHHMGTTRMHADPRKGVVDADCRVHGVENLFVAGSSVFPTYGYANPTLTIVALAVRLARHLHGELRSPVA